MLLASHRICMLKQPTLQLAPVYDQRGELSDRLTLVGTLVYTKPESAKQPNELNGGLAGTDGLRRHFIVSSRLHVVLDSYRN